MQSYRAEGYRRMSLLLFLTHYIRYYGIKTADDLRVTSYCDNSSLIKAEEEFHTRDVDSSSWYLKSDHDVIMTLNKGRKGLPFQLISRHVKSHQDDEREFDDLTRSEQLNVFADRRATAALDELRAADKNKELYPLPACRGYLRDASGLSPVANYARSEPNSLSSSFERFFKNATIGPTTTMIPSTGRPTDQPVPDSLTVAGLSWTNLVTAGSPLAYANDDAALRLISARNVKKSRRFPICTAARHAQRGVSGF
jgi:hypothetical protein